MAMWRMLPLRRHYLIIRLKPPWRPSTAGLRQLAVRTVCGVSNGTAHPGAATSSLPGWPRPKQTFLCRECGETSLQWRGRCPSCQQYNTLDRIAIPEPSAVAKGGGGGARAANAATDAGPGIRRGVGPKQPSRPSGSWLLPTESRPQRIVDISKASTGAHWRLPLAGQAGAEVARVLGGGVVPGSLTLVGGDPGVGKSTLLLQISAMLADVPLSPPPLPAHSHNGVAVPEEVRELRLPGDESSEDESSAVLYVSAEESVEQVGNRAQRMGLGEAAGIYLFNATRLDDILREVVRMRPRAVVVDSIQTVYLDDVAGSAGSISQVRECATAMLHVAKRQGVPIFLVGHVTKTGDIAGPRVLEHIVDSVLYMEGERHQAFRLLRGIKNRYGPTDEVGVFQMGETGLQAVANPSAVFLGERGSSPNVSAAVTVMIEGTRPLLLEVQALCSRVHHGQGPPMRIPSGVNRNRLGLILAVLSKHVRLRMYRVDVHTNVVGGLLMQEPATDLALAVAIVSSYFDIPTPQDIAVIGEIGLGGELRAVSHIERRLIEAAKLGFTAVIVPAAHSGPVPTRAPGLKIIPCRTVTDALAAALGTLPADTPPKKGRGSDDAEEGGDDFDDVA